MTHSRFTQTDLSNDEWNELVALKNAININPATVHPDKMELFTALLVKTLEGKGDPTYDS
jgi:DNA-directed RNA polymerase subunit E'/Rpb7